MVNPLDYILTKYRETAIIPAATKLDDPILLPAVDRKELAILFHELGYKIGAEIGVEQGKYSETLLSMNPGLKLYCVDAWARYSKYRDHVNQEKLNEFYRITEERLKKYDAILVRAFSADAAKSFKRDSLDFVYLDANHSLPFVIQDIHLWSEKVRPGGIIAGHDYIRYRAERVACHVVEAVGAWTKAYRIAPWFILGRNSDHPDGKPTEDGKSGFGRRARSWMWVKEVR